MSETVTTRTEYAVHHSDGTVAEGLTRLTKAQQRVVNKSDGALFTRTITTRVNTSRWINARTAVYTEPLCTACKKDPLLVADGEGRPAFGCDQLGHRTRNLTLRSLKAFGLPPTWDGARLLLSRLRPHPGKRPVGMGLGFPILRRLDGLPDGWGKRAEECLASAVERAPS